MELNLIFNTTYKKILSIQIFIFFILFCIGYTGSSFGLVHNMGSFISTDEHKIIGQYRGIRSDEWAVSTLLSIAQYNSKESFPINNTKFGVLGKHFAVCHDTGVPVKEISLIAKPATLGFFLFDLKHALSWYWLIPIFISINGIYLLLQILFKNQDLVNFILSLCLAFSYHSVAWSFWPSYQIGLGALSSSFFILLFTNSNIKNKLLYSILFALCTASFGLTLYLPRIIPVATLYLFIIISYFYIHKNNIFIRESIKYLMISVIIIAIIFFVWFYNNYEEIQSMINSVYPGKRRIYYGGKSLWDEFSGWLNPMLLRETHGFRNQSEISTYCSLLIPISFLLYFLRKKIDKIILSIILFLIFNYIYLYIGIPEIIGKISLWNRTTPRAIIGIELAQIIILAWIYNNKDYIIYKKINKYISILISIIIVYILIFFMPQILQPHYLNSKSFFVCIFLLFLNYYFILNKFNLFPIIFCISFMVSTLLWNPICIAPNYYCSNIPECVFNLKDLKYNGKFVVATGGHVRPNMIAALGIPVINCTSHYIDKDLYKTFYINLEDNKNFYNKFNHMIINIINLEKSEIKSIGDCIIFNISAQNYNFSLFKADILMSDKSNDIILKYNKKLNYIITKDNFSYYKIIH